MTTRIPTFTARRIATALAALALGAVGIASAGAANGAYATGSGYCEAAVLSATPPTMHAHDTGSIVGGSQLVGFRAILQRWHQPTRTWRNLTIGPLLRKQVGFIDFGELGGWFRTDGTEVTGVTNFHMRGQRGFFRLRYAMFWYSNGAVTGTVNAPAFGHRDDRVGGQMYRDFCRY